MADKNFCKWAIDHGGVGLPFTATAPKLSHTLADMARPFRVCLQPTRNSGVFERFLHAKDDGFGGEKPLLDSHSFTERIPARLSGGVHHTQERAPIHSAAA